MAIDLVAACEGSTQTSSTQSLALVLSILFSAYILVDSMLASFVILRKTKESEALSLGKVGPTIVY